jgi:hypothetical protein
MPIIESLSQEGGTLAHSIEDMNEKISRVKKRIDY